MFRELIFRASLVLGSLSLLTGFGLLAVSEIGQYEATPAGSATVRLDSPNAWAHPGATAILSCVRLNTRNIVYKDVGQNLLKGPVWLPVTAPPGTIGNFVVAAHRDTHFRFLKDVKIGDIFDVEAPRGRSRYRVSSLNIVQPTDRRLLAPHKRAVLTLVTCFPFYYVGSAPKRFIVRADLIPDDKPLVTSNPPIKISPGESPQ